MTETVPIENLDEWWVVFNETRIELIRLHNNLFDLRSNGEFITAIDNRDYDLVYKHLDEMWWTIRDSALDQIDTPHSNPADCIKPPVWKRLCYLLDSALDTPGRPA